MPSWHRSVTARVAAWNARTFLGLSVFGLTAELLIAASTLLPHAPVVPQWAPFALIAGIFVVHLRSVVLLVERRRGLGISGFRGLPLRAMVAGIPKPVTVGFIGLFLFAWLVGLSSIAHIGGQPTQIGSRFYLSDHGDLIRVSHSAYLHALVLQQRIFTMIPAVFYALGVIVNLPLAREGVAA
jgi:hypothetical protein